MTDQTQTEKGAVELDEKKLDQASGGIAQKIAPGGLKVGLKVDSAHKLS